MNRLSMNGAKGFSLIELLIGMIIIGILSSIAYSGYLSHMLKVRRSDAMGTMTQDQIAFERCYAQNFAYNAACTALPAFPQTSPQGYYSIALTNLSATTYTLTATPLGTQVKDTTCATMSVNQANVKTAADSGAASQTGCWSR